MTPCGIGMQFCYQWISIDGCIILLPDCKSRQNIVHCSVDADSHIGSSEKTILISVFQWLENL